MPENRICNICGVEYPKTEEYFYKHKLSKDGLLKKCKECFNKQGKAYREKNCQIIKERNSKYKNEHREEINARNRLRYAENNDEERRKRREYRENNREKINKWKREYRNKFPEKHRELDKKWHTSEKGISCIKKYKKENHEKIKKATREYHKKRRSSDTKYKLITNLRTRINQAIKNNYKSGKTTELIGCNIEELKKHIEQQFKQGMSWDNWSPDGWHIDHIMPCSSFDLTKEAEQKKCFHWSNLQPLWAEENYKKHTKILR